MKQSYNLCLSQVLQYEGGYVNNPKDPGGATNKGITQSTYDNWRASQGLPKRPVKALAQSELEAIYRSLYWDKVRGDDLPVGIDLTVFDMAVNSGVSRSAKFLQRLVGVPADGLIGPATIKAAEANQFGLTDKLCDSRLAFLKSLPTWKTFGTGWGTRVESVRALSRKMRKTYSDSISH